jgi:adenosylcobinamide-GDP ribazoletransferase
MRAASTFRLEARAAAAALTLLTRIPLGRWVLLEPGDIARSGALYPFVGAATGALVGGAATAAGAFMPALLAAGIALAFGVLLTGALHLDGLADTADALVTGTRADALRVMRDHHLGTYGVIALVLDLLLKASALAVLVTASRAILVPIAAGGLSRASAVALGATLPYGRPEGGTGASFTNVRTPRAAFACATAVAGALLIVRADGLVLVLIAAILTIVLARALRSWLGGVTGDALGAAVELIETASLVAGAALLGGA